MQTITLANESLECVKELMDLRLNQRNPTFASMFQLNIPDNATDAVTTAVLDFMTAMNSSLKGKADNLIVYKPDVDDILADFIFVHTHNLHDIDTSWSSKPIQQVKLPTKRGFYRVLMTVDSQLYATLGNVNDDGSLANVIATNWASCLNVDGTNCLHYDKDYQYIIDPKDSEHWFVNDRLIVESKYLTEHMDMAVNVPDGARLLFSEVISSIC